MDAEAYAKTFTVSEIVTRTTYMGRNYESVTPIGGGGGITFIPDAAELAARIKVEHTHLRSRLDAIEALIPRPQFIALDDAISNLITSMELHALARVLDLVPQLFPVHEHGVLITPSFVGTPPATDHE